MKNNPMRKVIIAIKDPKVDDTEVSDDENFGTGYRVPVTFWWDRVNMINKSDESTKVELIACGISSFKGCLELTTNAMTTINRGAKDPTWNIASEEQLPFLKATISSGNFSNIIYPFSSESPVSKGQSRLTGVKL